MLGKWQLLGIIKRAGVFEKKERLAIALLRGIMARAIVKGGLAFKVFYYFFVDLPAQY